MNEILSRSDGDELVHAVFRFMNYLDCSDWNSVLGINKFFGCQDYPPNAGSRDTQHIAGLPEYAPSGRRILHSAFGSLGSCGPQDILKRMEDAILKPRREEGGVQYGSPAFHWLRLLTFLEKHDRSFENGMKLPPCTYRETLNKDGLDLMNRLFPLESELKSPGIKDSASAIAAEVMNFTETDKGRAEIEAATPKSLAKRFQFCDSNRRVTFDGSEVLFRGDEHKSRRSWPPQPFKFLKCLCEQNGEAEKRYLSKSVGTTPGLKYSNWNDGLRKIKLEVGNCLRFATTPMRIENEGRLEGRYRLVQGQCYLPSAKKTVGENVRKN